LSFVRFKILRLFRTSSCKLDLPHCSRTLSPTRRSGNRDLVGPDHSPTSFLFPIPFFFVRSSDFDQLTSPRRPAADRFDRCVPFRRSRSGPSRRTDPDWSDRPDLSLRMRSSCQAKEQTPSDISSSFFPDSADVSPRRGATVARPSAEYVNNCHEPCRRSVSRDHDVLLNVLRTKFIKLKSPRPVLGPDLQKFNILRQSYDYLTIMPKLRSTYDRRLIYKTSYEGRKAFLGCNSLARS